MALGDPYASLADLKAYLMIGDGVDDTVLTDALLGASRDVEKYCGRVFNDAGALTPRVYQPLSPDYAVVDDFSTTTGLVVETDDDGDGVFETTWGVGDYELGPFNGVDGGEPGHPFHVIRAVGVRRFPVCDRVGAWGVSTRFLGRRARLRVTARWGWVMVPSPVRYATLMLASERFKTRDAPFGVRQYDGFGPAPLLDPYRRVRVGVG